MVLGSSLAAQPIEGIMKKVSDWEPVIKLVQDSTPDGQPMEGTAYLEHSALGCLWTVDSWKGCRVRLLSVVQPEETDMPERPALASHTNHEQACFTLSARPMLDPDIVIDTDVNADINTDLPENSAPMMNSDSSLLKCNAQPCPPGQDTQGCRPMEGITEPLQVELSGLALAIDRTNEEHLPTSNSRKQSDSIITGSQDYWKSTERTQVRLRHRTFQSGIGRCHATRGA